MNTSAFQSRSARCLQAVVRLLLATTLATALANAFAAGADERPWQTLPPTPALPDTADQGWTEVHGIRLWHARYGAADAGAPRPTVLLLHGGFASSNYWGHLIPFLVAQGYAVLAVDSRGQGRSTMSAAPLSYRLMASDVVALLDSLHIGPVDVVGWSDGGIIGIEMALHHRQAVHRLFAFGANVSVKGLKPDIDKAPVFAQYLARTQTEYGQLSATPNGFDAFSAKILAMWAHQPNYAAAELARIDTPVTVADGQYDEALRPEHQVYIARKIPRANLVTLPNVSHFAMLQNPAEFNEAVLAFLKYR